MGDPGTREHLLHPRIGGRRTGGRSQAERARPGARLMASARRRALDHLRRDLLHKLGRFEEARAAFEAAAALAGNRREQDLLSRRAAAAADAAMASQSGARPDLR